MRSIYRGLVLVALPVSACSTLAAPDMPLEPAKAQARYHLQALSTLAVTADSQLANAPASAVVDGNTSTAWSNGGYLAATAWVRLQFGADTTFTSLGVRMPPAAAGTSYDIQVSADGSAWTTAAAGLTNSSWNTESKALPAGTHGSYLRVFWHNSTSAPQPHVNIYELVPNGSGGGTGSPTPAPSATPTAMPSATPTPTPAPSGSPVSYPTAANPGANAAAGFAYNKGVPVANVNISVISSSNGSTHTVKTDAQGRYLVTGLPAGQYYAYYYNDADSNKIGYWKSLPATVSTSSGAVYPTIDLYLKGVTNTPGSGSRVSLPQTFSWTMPVQTPSSIVMRVHSQGGKSFTLEYQSSSLPGATSSYTWDGSGLKAGPLDPSHRYYWGVQWRWGALGEGGNLYQAVYFNN